MTVDILEWAAIVAHTVSKVTTALFSTFLVETSESGAN